MQPRPTKRAHLTHIAGHAIFVPALYVLAVLMAPPVPGAAGLTGLLVYVGLAAWIAGVAVCMRRLALRVEDGEALRLPDPSRYQRDMLVALALFSLLALVGFLYGQLGPRAYMLPLMGAALAGVLLFVLPLTLRYWSLAEGSRHP
jgi:hypothetical protein